MAKKTFLGMLAAGALVFSGLESKALDLTNQTNEIINVSFTNFTGNATADVHRDITEYKLEASAGAGGNVSGVTNNWFQSGYTNRLIAVPNTSAGYHFDGWNVNGSPASGSQTNDFIVNGVKVIVAKFSLNQYQFLFKDITAGVDVTNTVVHGSSFPTNFPKYVVDPNNAGVRYRATSLDSDGVGVVLP